MAKAASNPIPSGFRTLTPQITVKGASAYMDFLKKAFGAEEISRAPFKDGRLLHADARVGDSILMFNDEFPEFGQPPFAQGQLPFSLWMYVPDCDSVFNQAVAAGAQPTMPVGDQFWGDRMGQVKDPFGILWSIATRKEELTHEEIKERQAKFFSAAGGGR